MKVASRPGRWGAAFVFVRGTVIAAGLVTAYYALPLDGSMAADTLAWLVCGLLAVMVVFAWEVRMISRSPYPRLKAVEALAATVPLFLLLFASTYYLVGRSFPGTFSEPLTRTDALYFALTTFSTVGYGDITARSQAGRVLTMLQMAGGLLLVSVAVRVLAGAVQAGLRQRQRRGTKDAGGQ
ncbi:potassium channel family protein [Streptomyces chromofuscus]|uniref:Two pore domain potassium channel family protein n=1 Tax=Streptomyces chromofuscus TaxID=42881 RepID=A0A7M2TBG1_STRCW|nr:potassium channel family protein [Streptomyces chromofuscus]QOV45058.1 two pore domain potassium channel family protein [Streptomyces chromofuscus]GGT28031.1 metal transporter [Streptomyces chromofuscus]